jgi:hypothetical protein
MAGEAFAEMMAMSSNPDADPEAVMGQVAQLATMYLLLIPLALLFYGVMYAAVHRAVLRPEEGGFGFVKLGADELRQAVVLLLYFLLIGVLMIAGFIVLGVLAGLAGGAIGGLITLLGTLALLGACLWIGVRLSLCTPMTFAQKRIRLLESWTLTRGRFWPLLGGYVLAVIVSIVVFLLGLLIYAALAAVFGGGLAAVGSVMSPDFTTLAGYFSVAMILYIVVASLLSALTFAITVGAAAEAYREIAGGSQETTAEVFA